MKLELAQQTPEYKGIIKNLKELRGGREANGKFMIIEKRLINTLDRLIRNLDNPNYYKTIKDNNDKRNQYGLFNREGQTACRSTCKLHSS